MNSPTTPQPDAVVIRRSSRRSTNKPTASEPEARQPARKKRKVNSGAVVPVPGKTAQLDVKPLETADSTVIVADQDSASDGDNTLEAQPPTAPKKRVKKTKEPPPEPILADFPKRVARDWKVGVHVSTAGGVENAVSNAAQLGANAFALFLKSNRKWESPPLTETSIEKFKSRMRELQYDAALVLPHSTYLINMAAPDKEKREKAHQCFADDLKRCEQLGLTLCNFHPGSTTGKCSREEGIKNIADCLNRAHKEFPSVVTVIECMAGDKNIIGGAFEDLADIINLVEDKSKVGVCLDTCHMFCAGYDLRTKDVYEETMSKFESVVGFNYLNGLHFNDSKTPFNSRKDRHENVGLGSLGLQSFANLLGDRRMQNLPLILETPGFDLVTVWSKEIEILNSVCGAQVEGKEVDEVGLVSEVKEAIKTAERAGFGAKGKTPRMGGATAKKIKRKAKGGDEDDVGDTSSLSEE